MPEFAYRAANGAGAMVDGRIEAAGRDAALRSLRAQGLTPLKLDEASATSAPVARSAGAATPKCRLFERDRGPGHAEVHSFTSEMAIMLRAGLPLDRALRVLIGMSAKPSFTVLLEDVNRLNDRVLKLQTHFSQANGDIDQILISTGKVTKRGEKIEALEFEEGHKPLIE